MKNRKLLKWGVMGVGLCGTLYIAGYLHFVRPMPLRVGTSDQESVEPVFRSANSAIIRLFRPVVGIDQSLFPGRWNRDRFQLPSTNLAGLRTMRPFSARVESVGRTMPNDTKLSTLQMGLRLESGHFLKIVEPGATEQMFARAGALMDSRLHEFPASWFLAGNDK
jgi:hypothetical protein